MILLKFLIKRLSLAFFVTFLTNNIAFSANSYVQIKLKSGEGMYTLFKKYHIPATSCNINHFKEINKIKKLNHLLTGKAYNLPILKLAYNGKSVTSSLKVNKTTASRVIQYNKLLLTQRKRTASYITSRQVWVVYGDIHCDKAAVVMPLATKKNTAQPSSNNEERRLKTPTPLAEKVNLATVQEPAEPNTAIPSEANTDNDELIVPKAFNINTTTLRIKTLPVFGKEFEDISITSDRLKNKIYYLVSGHGGPDPGTMYQGDEVTLCEDEYAYDVTLRLARKLIEEGAQVHLIVQDPNDGIRDDKYLKIDKDERCITGYPLVLNQRLRLTQTTDAVNDLYRKYRNKGIPEKDQLTVHLHIDSRHKDMRQDVFFYYQEGNEYSYSTAQRVQKTLDKKYEEASGKDYKGSISSRQLFVMRNTICPTVYMELGNIQNLADQKRIIYPSNRAALAEWLFAGITGEE